MPSETYRLICVVDSVQDGDQTISEIDASPDYLHIHILKSDQLQTIEEFSSKLSNKTKNETLFQWGIPLQKDAKTRSEKVSATTIKEFGHIGLGSAARGTGEQIKDFTGGGEGFLLDDQNFRITRGNKAFKADETQKYWTFQVADFNGAGKFSDLKGKTISSRNSLMQSLEHLSGGKPFVATFDVEFEGDFLARSNGIFPEDEAMVQNPNQTVFDTEIQGGHLVGGTTNQGDIDSIKLKFPDSKFDEIDFVLTVKSDIILKPISELQIAKSNGGFRAPRTETQVKNAVRIVEKYRRQVIDGRQS